MTFADTSIVRDDTSMAADLETLLYGGNAPYILALYQDFLSDPQSVSSDWQAFFAHLSVSGVENMGDDRAPVWAKDAPARGRVTRDVEDAHPSQDMASHEKLLRSLRALMLIRAYRVRGHLNARLDPLGLDQRVDFSELQPESYGFKPEDLDKHVFVDHVLGLENPTLREILTKLKETYGQTLGVEFMHMQDPDQKSWVQERVENTPRHQYADLQLKKNIAAALVAADAFERFLHVKYPGAKRFGLEGGESLIPALETLLSRAASTGVEKVVLGMAHRGRLSVLANTLHKPFQKILAQFQAEDVDPTIAHGSGDVKYHLGYSSTRIVEGKPLKLTLMPNPSHLEAVNPVVLGKARAEQTLLKDDKRRRVLSVLMHGDAAFAGQGLVAETLELSALRGYKTGGTIHIIINNQIGFTTSPPSSRSSPYSSDMAKAIQAPIFHVNGDDPEAVAWAMQTAVDYQREFGQDVVLDLVCYRRHGHNEIDDPSFTQPRMYRAIATHQPVAKSYTDTLIQEGALTTEDVQEMTARYREKLQEDFESLTETQTKQILSQPQWLTGTWEKIKPQASHDEELDLLVTTGADQKTLREIVPVLTRVPEGFHINKRLARLLKQKEEILRKGSEIDWATAEALAFGTLLKEGYPVRLSGQDVGRGTFSHRHAVWVDQETEDRYIPLNHLSTPADFEIVDSPLAEASVLGFEYGYSLADPTHLAIWEAQFGDFSNGAQVIIDQFIASGEVKWNRLSAIVLLLPHGYEGQGPEHSSARIERYLQLCAENNMRVVNCSTPASYFHALRRQMHGQTRKPLIIFSPKSLLRHKHATSTLQDLMGETAFMPVIDDTDVSSDRVKRVILCSGKVYYDLWHARAEQKRQDIALIRLEQYYPFPDRILRGTLQKYKNAQIIWCQEEPQNMGAWFFLTHRLEDVLTDIQALHPRPIYAGRSASASPATGNAIRHEKEQEQLISDAFMKESSFPKKSRG